MPSEGLTVNIDQHIAPQFIDYLELDPVTLRVPPKNGAGYIKFVDLPGKLEFYHFVAEDNGSGGSVRSINPTDSEWYLIHMNLSGYQQRKEVDGEVVHLHKHAPAGMLLYCPGIDIFTRHPPHSAMEFSSIRFHKSFLEEYFPASIISPQRTFIYEDLDVESERWLRNALSSMDDKMECHSWVLKILHRFCKKLERHENSDANDQFHPADIKGLFMASGVLRNPLSEQIPSIEELASIAGMSPTKFKTSFRLMFGSAPRQFHTKIKMEYAREQLQLRKQQPVEISYALGYSHPSNFTAAFKKFFGELPSEVPVLQ